MGTRLGSRCVGQRGGFVVMDLVRCVWATDGVDLLGERADGVGVDGHAKGRLVFDAVVADLEVEGVVQFPLVVLGQQGRIDGALRQQVEQGRVTAASILVLAVQRGEPLVGGASVGGDLREPALQGWYAIRCRCRRRRWAGMPPVGS